jgi:hypothetical protein
MLTSRVGKLLFGRSMMLLGAATALARCTRKAGDTSIAAEAETGTPATCSSHVAVGTEATLSR